METAPHSPEADDDTPPRPVFVHFTGSDIRAEMGRLAFLAINAFALNGHPIRLFDSLPLDRPDEERPYLQRILDIPGLERVQAIPEQSREWICLFDQPDAELTRRQWHKRIQVGFDIYGSHLLTGLRGIRPVMMPYAMHPLLYRPDLGTRLEAARRAPRRARIFFSGDTEGYRRNRVTYPAPKLTRSQVVDTLLEGRSDHTLKITDELAFHGLRQSPYQHRFAFVDNTRFRIPPELWLESLALGDFFLAPPGYVMPMCHNIVEAMAVGAIPFTNYPEWMTPALKPGVHCIAFQGREDLLARFDEILAMPPERIEDMRRAVIRYYEDHLEPRRFIQRLLARPEPHLMMLMITDGCVARKPDRLNRHSILLTGRPRELPSLLQRPLQRLLAKHRAPWHR